MPMFSPLWPSINAPWDQLYTLNHASPHASDDMTAQGCPISAWPPERQCSPSHHSSSNQKLLLSRMRGHLTQLHPGSTHESGARPPLYTNYDSLVPNFKHGGGPGHVRLLTIHHRCTTVTPTVTSCMTEGFKCKV